MVVVVVVVLLLLLAGSRSGGSSSTSSTSRVLPGFAALECGRRDIQEDSSRREGGRSAGCAEGEALPFDPHPECRAVEAAVREGGR